MIVFFHSADLDGIASAAIVKFFHSDCKLYPFNQGYKFPWKKLSQEYQVFMADMSLPMKDMIEIVKRAGFVWIDHHSTALEEAEKAAFNPKGLRSVEEAACELTWRYLSENEMPKAVKLLGRYDVGDFSYSEDVKDFQFGIKSVDHGPKSDIWKELLVANNHLVDEIIAQGKFIRKFVESENKRFVKSYSFKIDFEGYKALVVNRQPSGSAFFESSWESSECDIMLAFAMFQSGNDKLWKFSLFSDKGGVDVGQIAKKFGGGGHKNAAGFTLDHVPFEIPGFQ